MLASECLQHGSGSGLFASSTRASNATFGQVELGNFTFHVERLLVRSTQSSNYTILREFQLAALKPFLQVRLCVFANGRHGGIYVQRLEKPVHQSMGRGKTAIQIDCPDNRLECVRQDGRTLLTSRAHLAFTQTDDAGKPKLNGEPVQRILLHKIGSDPRKIALCLRTQPLEKQVSYREIEYGIAQKLQAFVVVGVKASMRQCTTQQIGIRKLVLQTLLQCQQTMVHAIWNARST